MTSQSHGSLTSKSHQVGGDLSWMERAACRGKRDFLDRPEPEQDLTCGVCPVSRACRKARLLPRQIGAMP